MRFLAIGEPLVFHLLWNKTFLQADKPLAVERGLVWKRYALSGFLFSFGNSAAAALLAWKLESALYLWLRGCFRSDKRARSMPGLTSSMTNPIMAPAVARKAVRTVCEAATIPPITHVISIRVRPTDRIQGAVLRTSRERLMRL